ncbi:MAG TPA: type II toxin-antitoxin system prevent-host-death family antitoxin [Allosphingosinicella sp.]
MKHVSIKDAKNRFPALAREAEEGERIVITRNGKPIAELGPHKKSGGIDWEAMRRWKKERGLPEIVAVMSEDFDDPLPEDFLLRPLP